MVVKIDWALLKQTPIGSGIIPGLGMRYHHLGATSMAIEQIIIPAGIKTERGENVSYRILRKPSLKSGWSKPHQVCEQNFSAWNEPE